MGARALLQGKQDKHVRGQAKSTFSLWLSRKGEIKIQVRRSNSGKCLFLWGDNSEKGVLLPLRA